MIGDKPMPEMWYTLREFEYKGLTQTFSVAPLPMRFEQEWQARAAAIIESQEMVLTGGYLVVREYEKFPDGSRVLPNELIAMYIKGSEYKHVDE